MPLPRDTEISQMMALYENEIRGGALIYEGNIDLMFDDFYNRVRAYIQANLSRPRQYRRIDVAQYRNSITPEIRRLNRLKITPQGAYAYGPAIVSSPRNREILRQIAMDLNRADEYAVDHPNATRPSSREGAVRIGRGKRVNSIEEIISNLRRMGF